MIKGSDVQNASLLRFALLSAVFGTRRFLVACGIGFVIMTPVWLLPQSELDYLI